jgi:hypothetical protein
MFASWFPQRLKAALKSYGITARPEAALFQNSYGSKQLRAQTHRCGLIGIYSSWNFEHWDARG